MILTERFVLLNYPRTGSTFVRAALRALHGLEGSRLPAVLLRWTPRGRRCRELTLPIERTASARRAGRRSQHGALHQIPASHRHLPVVSVTRHPLDREVSQYEHGFWREHPPAPLETLLARFPAWPALSFGEYRALQAEHGRADVLQGAPLRAEVGAQTLHFLRFFHPNPDAALAQLDDARIDDGSLLRELPPVRFLHTERLVPELRAFLHEHGFEPRATAFLEDWAPVNAAASRAGRPWSDYFDAEEERRFRREERLLFQLFPEYGEPG